MHELILVDEYRLRPNRASAKYCRPTTDCRQQLAVKASFEFYESQETGLHRSLARRFPFALHCDFDGRTALVLAVLDCRRNPRSIRSALATRRQP